VASARLFGSRCYKTRRCARSPPRHINCHSSPGWNLIVARHGRIPPARVPNGDLGIDSTAGFGAELAPSRYPGPTVLAALLQRTTDPFQIWRTVLATALEVHDVAGLTWAERLDWVQQNPEPMEHALAEADKAAGEQGRTRLILFDALEHLHEDRSVTDTLVAGVLRLALELRTRTKNLRAKVFIRRDMLTSSQLHFPDSSKLIANPADLTWTETNLYGLLFHLLGNAESGISQQFRTAHPAWHEERRADTDRSTRYRAPTTLSGDAATQQRIFTDIAGPYMGTDHRKGHTYTWLPNHLMDGIGQVSPRSFLSALATAVQDTRTRYAGYRYALHFEGIRRGVQAASAVRVGEITEDLPWVAVAVEALAGTQVPMDPEMILERWAEGRLGDRLIEKATEINKSRDESKVRTGPRDPANYPQLIEELVQLGVMSPRANGRIDLPDVYRVAFGIGRRGGVPRIRGS